MTQRPDDPLDPDADYTRDPGGPLEDAGVPDVADDSSPGSGEVPEPEVPAVPTDAPTAVDAYGTTAREQAEGQPLEDRLDAELPEDYTEPDDAATGYVTDEP
ncbi:hypothetical protein [Jiangella gansuensis]|uniref:hypothetical protein n=1 Tax=Jiangella gansuensis TaxID=281473 RepID=UPI0004AECC33|nr:hypothetical protein [Jiangella gansuensis]